MTEIIREKPKGIIFDIASLKSKIKDLIIDAQEKGIRISSIHPMFGPDSISLEHRNLVICTTNHSTDINNEIVNLFSDTSVNLVYTPLEKHDEYISYTLGLSHFINLLMGHVLENSPFNLEQLDNYSGTTFDKQVKTTKEVFSENPELYYSIQSENNYSEELYSTIKSAFTRLIEKINTDNSEEFIQWMRQVNYYLNEEMNKDRP